MNEQIIEQMLERRYLIFAPKNAKDLRVQYPELAEYAEFRPEAIKTHDLLFVWWFRCAASPYYDMEDSEKLESCVRLAYPTEQQRESKLKEFKAQFPDNIKSAFKRMESFNLAARVENYLYTQRVRDNCKAMLAVDINTMDIEEQESWSKRAPAIWRLLEETSKALEKGGFGVVESENTTVEELDGSVKSFRQSRR
jgi:hypothetical protein